MDLDLRIYVMLTFINRLKIVLPFLANMIIITMQYLVMLGAKVKFSGKNICNVILQLY